MKTDADNIAATPPRPLGLSYNIYYRWIQQGKGFRRAAGEAGAQGLRGKAERRRKRRAGVGGRAPQAATGGLGCMCGSEVDSGGVTGRAVPSGRSCIPVGASPVAVWGCSAAGCRLGVPREHPVPSCVPGQLCSPAAGGRGSPWGELMRFEREAADRADGDEAGAAAEGRHGAAALLPALPSRGDAAGTALRPRFGGLRASTK